MKSNSLVLVIQARFNSSRLPGKIKKKLCGITIIERILQRVKKIKKINKIIIATTKRKDDNFLVKIAKKHNVEIFRGSTNNCVDRYYKAVKNLNAKHVLRLPADNPLPEPSEYNRIINYHIKSRNDFSSNIINFMNNGYPDGIGVEIFTFKSLVKIWKAKKTKEEKEHLATNYYNYEHKKKNKKFNFKIGTIKCPKNISRPDLKLDINYKKDYLYINNIYKYFDKKKINFTIKDVIYWHDKVYLNNIYKYKKIQ
jgi:spore coat polysaccharide biosynthesis protein SpsF